VILVDASVWIDHLRCTDATLARLLETSQILCHAFVIGELACGSLLQREVVIDALRNLPEAPVARQSEALVFLNRHALAGRGIGWVDVHLLASTALAGGARLWTHDKRLASVAADLGMARAPT
jgi:predicted nucleic acid-binding protein